MNSSDSTEHQLLNDLYIAACRALLEAYGLTVNVQERRGDTGPRNQANYVSVLSANGEGISLSSMLKIDRDLVISLHPMSRDDMPQPDLEDWCMELNNQLVGRLKNKLIGYGAVVVIGLPLLLTGTNVSSVAAPESEVHQYSVESADGQITLTLATLIAAGVRFHEPVPCLEEENTLFEGMVALF
jgi:hypothetical protein